MFAKPSTAMFDRAINRLGDKAWAAVSPFAARGRSLVCILCPVSSV